MGEKPLEKPTKVINAIDKSLRDAILRLDQKLKGLRAEALVKIENIIDETDSYEALRKSNLNLLIEDLDNAIDSIEGLVNIVITEDATTIDIAKITREVENLRDIISENTDVISKLKERF